MIDLLTEEERFEDRLEITGYVTAGIAGLFLLTFFGMLFFYKPVRTLPTIVQILTMAASIFALTVGFFIPRGSRMARILFRIFFLWLGAYAYFKSLEQGHWLFLPLLLYSGYILWVLGHPTGIRFFRPLKPHEEKQLPLAGWLTFHVTVLSMTALLSVLKGIKIISSTESDPLYDPDRGMALLFMTIVLWFLLFFFRRMKNWARWSLAILGLALGIFGIPDTVSIKITHYVEYWKKLAVVFYGFGLALYLVFSKSVKQGFSSLKKAG